MQGAPKRQVNAEDMLAELKRALESSTHAPDAPPPAASTTPKSSSPKSSSPDRESRRSQIDRGSDRPAKANAKTPIGPRTDLQKSNRPSSRSWKLIAGGLALAGAAAICVSFALMSKAPDLPEREPSVAATETLEPSSSPRAPIQDSPQAMPSQAATLVTSHRIGPDGAPIATSPPTPASTDSSLLAEAPKAAAPSAASPAIRPDGEPVATAPPTPPSTDSAPLTETPKPAAAPVASQMVKPDGAPIATPPSTPASTVSAHLTETPKPNATSTAHVSNESTQPSKPKIDLKKKPLVKTALQKLLGSPKPPVKSIAPIERQSTDPAPPKEAEKSPQPTQEAGSPTALAPVKTTSVQQRVADGVTHAFGYLVHLPGALIPHLGGPNPDGH
jgi:hypothetical protein